MFPVQSDLKDPCTYVPILSSVVRGMCRHIYTKRTTTEIVSLIPTEKEGSKTLRYALH